MKEQFISTVTSKSQTVIPKAIRAKMGLKPGDLIRYSLKGNKVEIEKFTDTENLNPFFSFTEWASDEDDRAFAHLEPRG